MTWGSFCRKAFEITLLFTLFFVPIAFSPFFVRTFAIPKAFIFQLGTALAALFFICSIIFHAPTKFSPLAKNHKIALGSGFFLLGLMMLSTIFSAIPSVSFWGSYYRLQGMIAFSHYFLMGILVFIYVQQNLHNIHRIFAIIISSASLASIYAIAQRFGFDQIFWDDITLVGRVFGPLSNPSSLAQFMVLTIPLTMGCFIACKKRLLTGSALILQLLALIFSQGRMAALAVAISLLCFFFFITQVKLRKKFAHFVIGLAVTTALLLGSLFTLQHYKVIPDLPLLNRLNVNEVNIRSFSVRQILWSSSLPLLIDRPLLGFGADTFHYVYAPYRDPALHSLEDINASPDRTHNELYDFTIFFGWPFILLYLFFAFVIARICYQFVKKEKYLQNSGLIIGMGSALLGHFLVNLMSFSLTSQYMLASVYIGSILGFTALLSSQKRTSFELQLSKVSGPLLLSGSVIVFLAFSWIAYLPPVYADFLHKQSLSRLYITNSDALDVLSPLETAARTMPMHGQHAHYYAELVRTFFDDPSIDESIKKQMFDTATELMNMTIEYNPLDSSSYVQMALLQSSYASRTAHLQGFNSAQWNMRKALELNPKMPAIFMEFGNVFFENQKWESAKEKYEQYLALIPEYWKWKDDIQKKTDYEQVLYRAFLRFNPQFDAVLMKLARSYANTGDFKKAESYLFYVDDQNFEKYVILGDIYRFGDRFSKATAAYRKALELSPDNPAIKKSLSEAEKGITLDEEVVRSRRN